MPFHTLSVDDGLPVNSAWTICQDHNGVMWMGSVDGLSRYDGTTIQVFRHRQNDSTSISDNCRHDLYVAKNNDLWIAHNQGISIYHQRTATFQNIFIYPEKNSLDITNRVIGEDADGNFWTWLYGIGLVKFDPSGKKIAQFGLAEINNYKCISGSFSKNGDIFLSLDMVGIWKFDRGSGTFSKIFQSNLGPMIFTRTGNMIVAGPEHSLALIDPSGKILQQFFAKEITADPEGKSMFFSALIEYAPNIFYAGSTIGIFVLDLNDGTFKRFDFSESPMDNRTIGDCLFKDRSGNLWAGTKSSGVRCILMQGKKFTLLTPYDKDQTIAKSIASTGRYTFVGYFGGGMDIYSDTHELIDHTDVNNSNVPVNDIYGIMPLSDDDLLLSFIYWSDMGILHWKTKQYQSLSSELNRAFSGFANLGIYSNCMTRDAEGNIIFNRDCYIFEAKQTDNTLRFSLIDSLPGTRLTYVYRDHADRLWAGSFNGVYVKISGAWKKAALPVSLNVKCIMQQPNGEIWVSGDQGVFMLDANGNVLSVLNQTNGLPNDYVYALLTEPGGNCWMSHNRGISCWQINSKTVKNYSVSDGVQSNEFDTGAFCVRDGWYYLGGIKGVNYFRPENIRENKVVPITLISNILVNDMPFHSDTSFNYLKTIQLTYKQNTISFQYTACEYTAPMRNQFKYRLTGVDKNWVDAGGQRQARYPDLHPGKYTFEVISCNSDGIWNMQPAIIALTIFPPYWQTVWFRTILLILTLLLLSGAWWAFYRWRTARQRRQFEMQQKLQEERERISRDLHDNVGAQLSFINSNIDWIVHPVTAMAKEEEQERLISISETAQNIIGNLRETIWALNKNEIDAEDLSDKLKAYFQKQLRFNESIALQVTESVENTIRFSPSVALNIFRIGQEALHNCIKYSGADIIQMEITTNAAGDFFLVIADNGKGFETDNTPAGDHYGLENMKGRAEAINGRLSIVSSPGNGTRIELTIQHSELTHL